MVGGDCILQKERKLDCYFPPFWRVFTLFKDSEMMVKVGSNVLWPRHPDLVKGSIYSCPT